MRLWHTASQDQVSAEYKQLLSIVFRLVVSKNVHSAWQQTSSALCVLNISCYAPVSSTMKHGLLQAVMKHELQSVRE